MRQPEARHGDLVVTGPICGDNACMIGTGPDLLINGLYEALGGR
jgi:hypothetical protein